MRLHYLKPSLLALILTLSFSCSDDDVTETPTATTSETSLTVKNNYANLVSKTYTDLYNKSVIMQTKINAFTDAPSAVKLDEAKTAWKEAREIYGLSESFREANGPVDVENSATTPWGLGTEGLMNAWPIDEGYIDYVKAGTEAYAGTFKNSIIGNSSITITQAIIQNKNEAESDKSISSGWHAIEFLLWGQDNTAPIEDKPGQRLYTDYTTAPNASRRTLYLKTATDLLVSNLLALKNTWAEGGTYRTIFNKLDNQVALKQLINGPFFIAGDEASSERMIAPVNSTGGINNSGQEDEQSCFSDNTHRDIYANAKGAYNVVFGKYDIIDGASFYDLVNQANPAQAKKLLNAGNDVITKVNVIANNAKPFDYLITQETSTDASFGPVMTAVKSLQDFADIISASASTIGISL